MAAVFSSWPTFKPYSTALHTSGTVSRDCPTYVVQFSPIVPMGVSLWIVTPNVLPLVGGGLSSFVRVYSRLRKDIPLLSFPNWCLAASHGFSHTAETQLSYNIRQNYLSFSGELLSIVICGWKMLKLKIAKAISSLKIFGMLKGLFGM